MDDLFKFVSAIVVGIWLGLLLFTFDYNLPDWCAHPARPGNNLIQPFCR
jgi:hypothetical protein